MTTDHPVNASYLGLSPAGFHKLNYVRWGKPTAARTVLCVHGMTRNSRDFDFLARAIVEGIGARVVAVDIVGRGDSDWLPNGALYTYPQYLADINALIARLDCERIDWIGTSMGGIIGMLLAAQANTPLRSLFMNDIGPEIPVSALQRLAQYVGQAPSALDTFDDLLSYIKDVHAPYGSLTQAEWLHLASVNARQTPDGKWRIAYDPDIGFGLQNVAKDGMADLWSLWDKITLPILLYRGKESDLLTEETTKRMAAKADIVEWDGIGHAPALYNARQITPIVEWLKALG